MRERKPGVGRFWWLARRGAGLLLAGLAGWVWLAMALLGCRPSAEAVADGDDPLAALAVAAPSARFDGAFWTREAHRNSRTWRAAKAFCRETGERRLPNCHAVELIERWEGPWFTGAPEAQPATLPTPPGLRAQPGLPAPPGQAEPPALPALPLPPPLPPAMHPDEPGRLAADVAALKAWEARLLARGKDAAAGGPR